jgi:DNA-binding winged helix-turn-helix (wHTH) protein
MAASTVYGPSIRFDLFELDPKTLQLRRGGLPVDLPPQALKILFLLASRPDQLVTRDEIKEALWPEETHGDFDSRLNVTIKELREALGDDAERPRYVQTVRKGGYRFIAPVRQLSGVAMPVLVPSAPANSTDTAAAQVGLAYVPPVLEPTRRSALKLLLLGFLLGVAFLGLAQWLRTVHGKPVILRVSAITADQSHEIRIVGHGLGRHVPFNVLGLDTPYLMIGDETSDWMAAKMDPDRVSDVTVLVQDWSDTLITIKGFSGMYGLGDAKQGNWRLHDKDQVRIRVWNPQTGVQADDCLVTVGSGDTVCSK